MAKVADVLCSAHGCGNGFYLRRGSATRTVGPGGLGQFHWRRSGLLRVRNAETLTRFKDAPGLVICSREVEPDLPEGSYLFTALPRAAFIMASWVFASLRPSGIHPTAVVDPRAEIGEGASIGPLSVIGAVRIGLRAVIGAQVSISDHTVAGDDLVVQNGAHIGGDGLGSMADGHGHMHLFPHFDRLIVGNRVAFGTGVIVQRGVLKPTVIGDDTHFSMGCFVGHNAQIGSGIFCAPGASNRRRRGPSATGAACGRAPVSGTAWSCRSAPR